MPDAFQALIHDDVSTPELISLLRARRVLGGLDEHETRRHPSMFDDDVISFAHGEGVRRPSPNVVSAGVKALLDTKSSSLENYLFLQRLEPLDRAIHKAFCRIGVPDAAARNVVIDGGSTRLLLGFLQLIAQPGSVFLTAPGFYHPLAAWCTLHRSRLICVPTRSEKSYKLLADDLAAWWESHVDTGIVAHPRALFLFNPSICGAVYTEEELFGLADFLKKNDVVAVEDAIFSETEFAGVFGPRLSAMPDMVDRVLTVCGGSKVHGLANIRIAWACGPKTLIEQMNNLAVTTSATLPQVSKLMALAALESPEIYNRQNRIECAARAGEIAELTEEINQRLSSEFELPSYPIVDVEFEPQAGHALLLSFEGLEGMRTSNGTVLKDSIDLVRYFLETAKVAFSPGLSIGWQGCRVRCTYACVGTTATYPASEMNEIRAVIDELSRHWNGQYALSDAPLRVSRLLETLLDSLSHSQPADFAVGRREIRTAFRDRLLPALRNLCAANCKSASVPIAQGLL